MRQASEVLKMKAYSHDQQSSGTVWIFAGFGQPTDMLLCLTLRRRPDWYVTDRVMLRAIR